MKHDLKITLVLLAMFLATQIIGLIVIDAYSPQRIIQVEKDGKIIEKTVGGNITIPYDMAPPEMDWRGVVPSIMIAILLATLIFFVLTRLKAAFIIRAWFFFVVLITTSISLTALLSKFHPSWDRVLTLDFGYPLTLVSAIAFAIALVLAFYKIVKRNFLIHNFTELLIYPGLASIFVPLFVNLDKPNVGIQPPVFWCIILLLLISLYDAYAVWKSKHMISLAKYQIQNLKLFTGFFLPYVSNRSFEQIKKLKGSKNIKMQDVKKETQKIKISLAILGGGDVAFPLIFAGIVLRAFSFAHALIVAVAVTISLLLLFIMAKKEKFYPAMPFLTAGCLVGYLITLLIPESILNIINSII